MKRDSGLCGITSRDLSPLIFLFYANILEVNVLNKNFRVQIGTADEPIPKKESDTV